MGKTYTFRSPLPPEELPGALSGERKTRDRTGNAEISMKIRWKGSRFTVRRTTVRRYTGADGWVPTVRGLGRTRGRRTDWRWNNPFCGAVRPDGRGGSVLTGRFRIHPAGKVLFAAFAVVIVYGVCFLSPHTVMAAVAMLYLRHLIRASRTIDSCDGAEDILRFLREQFEEVEE